MQRTEIPDELATLLRRYRIEARLTQEALAERADVGLRTIQGIERGERRPHRTTVQRLVSALNLSTEQRRHLDALARPFSRPPRLVTPIPPTRGRASRPETSHDAPSHVPAPLTSFVGRQWEVGEVKRLLATSRLVTLTGPPGVGKTRLAQEIVADLADDGADVRFVSLAPIRDPELVLAILAQAARVEGFEHQPLVERLIETLRDRPILFALDNFEQVVAAAPLVAELLEGCPRLSVLVTSRVRLRVRGERELVVPPLAVPDPDMVAVAADLTAAVRESEAGRLFVDRARDVRPDLIVDRDNASAIAEICRRMDGLPLAIELAAARCKLLAPPALLVRLRDRLAMLTAGAVDLPPRQRTLREAIAWSHELLDAEERVLFRRLAVFADGFTLSAAEAVCGGTLDRIAALVDQSLMRLDPPHPTDREGEPRFLMLETIREFAREQLAASGDETALPARHAVYYLAFAEDNEPGVGVPVAGWLHRLAREHGNLQAALRFLLEHRDGERAARLASALASFWVAHGYVDVARAWLGEILALVGDSDRTLTRADLLCLAGRLAFNQSDNALARRRVEESLAIYREIGDLRRVATALWVDGLIARWQGQYDLAWRRFEEQRAIWQELNDPLWLAESDDVLGVVAFWMGDGARGRALLENALAEMRRLGDRVTEGCVLYNLGFVAHGLGDYPAALDYYEERLAMARAMGARLNIGEALGGLGDLALDRGDLESARADLTESLTIHRDLGNRREIAHVLECFAGLAARQRQPEHAVRLWAAAAALREAIGEPIPPDQVIRLDRRLGRLHEVVGEEVFARAWAAGQALTMAEAVAAAFEKTGA